MSDIPENPEAREQEAQDRQELPRARLKRRRWNAAVIWVVPVVAAIVAGYLVYGRVREFGPKITISFKDAAGVRVDETPVKYRGVSVGLVKAVRLSADHQSVLVEARLHRSAASIAAEGAVFWIVKPEVGIANVTGLGTVLTGPHLEVVPGTGAPRQEFVGLESAPAVVERKGLRVVLLSNRLGSVKRNSPVYYRGVEVGLVEDSRLSGDAMLVETHLFISQRYARLVRTGTKFWNVSGLDVSFGIFKGLEINMESLKTLLGGGIAFATPEDSKAPPARNGMKFPLYDQAKKEWLQWSPKIPLPPAEK